MSVAAGNERRIEDDATGVENVDVVVVGSGAGGLAAAVTARLRGLSVVVLEKEEYFGGTTARSGGVLWIPGNPVNAREGVTDSTDAARIYLAHETGNFFDIARVNAFLENGPEMVRFFQENTSVRFLPNVAFADYHPDAPGGTAGGRSIVAAPLQGTELGVHFKDLRPPLREITFVGMMFNASAEVQHFFKATRSLKSFAYVVKRLMSHAVEVLRYGRAARLTNGNALAARLAKSAFDADIGIRLRHAVVDLVTQNGRVVGVVVDTPERRHMIRARRGVVLACGGFPLDIERRRDLFKHAPTGSEHFSPASPGNTGDGLRLGARAGGALQDDLPEPAAWIPVSLVRYRNGTIGHFPHLIDRYKPGVIAVTRDGKRFVNEAQSYHDVGQAMIRACRGAAETAAWLICDHVALSRYGMGFVKPFPVPRFHHVRSGYLTKASSLRELAELAGINSGALQETVARFNEKAVLGEDPEFGKGTTAYNRFLGDPDHKPNPCVAPLDTPPYYAIKLVLGDLGTFAGLKTDAQARVLNASGEPVPGLFAVGNDMASIMGGNYPGGGITLGPAMTFGYIAGNYLAHQHAET